MTLIKPDDPFSPDPSAPDLKEALKLLQSMQRMEDAMGDFEMRFGTDAFWCVIDSLYRVMPEESVLRTQRFRYLAQRIARGEKN